MSVLSGGQRADHRGVARKRRALILHLLFRVGVTVVQVEGQLHVAPDAAGS